MWFMMVAILVMGRPLVESPLPNKFVTEDACIEYGAALNEAFEGKEDAVEFGFKCVHYFEG